jgi:uncharacterized membrane protein YjgN (DUF898 family)
LCCATSIIVCVFLLVDLTRESKPNAAEYAFIAVCTVVPWVIGRALRYILGGE